MQGDWVLNSRGVTTPRVRRSTTRPTEPEASGGTSWPWLAWAALSGIAVSAYFLLGDSQQSIVYNVIGTVSSVVMLVAVRARRLEPRGGWLLLAGGNLMMAGGDILYGTFQSGVSTADILYLSGHMTIAMGLFLVIRGTLPAGRRPALMDAVAITAIIMASTLVFLSSATTEMGLGESAASIAYPALDFVALGLVTRLAAGSRGSRSRFVLLLVAAALILIADVGYSMQGFASAYVLGQVLDAGWLLSYVVFACAFLHPNQARGDLRGSAGVIPFHRADAFVPFSGALVAQIARARSLLAMVGMISMAIASAGVLMGVAWRAPEALFAGGVYGMTGLAVIFGSAVTARR